MTAQHAQLGITASQDRSNHNCVQLELLALAELILRIQRQVSVTLLPVQFAQQVTNVRNQEPLQQFLVALVSFHLLVLKAVSDAMLDIFATQQLIHSLIWSLTFVPECNV